MLSRSIAKQALWCKIILVFDVLSRMISQAQSTRDFVGIQLANSAPTLTHLFFADDDIIFLKDSPTSVATLTGILNKFTSASGQRINSSKSGIIFGTRTPNFLKESVCNIINILVWQHPGNYLGVPAEWGRAKIQNTMAAREGDVQNGGLER